MRAAAAAVGVTLPDEAVIKMPRPLAQKPRDPLTSDRNRSGEHWDSPIFDVVDHREFVQALRWHAMQGLAEPAHREILNAEGTSSCSRTRGATSSSTACTTPTRRARAARSRRTTGWATTGRG